jgi:signal transduction histidine kinase
MEPTLQKIERLIAEIGGAPLDDEATLARVQRALTEVGTRLRERTREAPNDIPPPGPPLDRADRLADEAKRIGHDLNNCLGVVGGRTELLSIYLDRGKVDDMKRGIDVIMGQLERMKELSDELRGLRQLA